MLASGASDSTSIAALRLTYGVAFCRDLPLMIRLLIRMLLADRCGTGGGVNGGRRALVRRRHHAVTSSGHGYCFRTNLHVVAI